MRGRSSRANPAVTTQASSDKMATIKRNRTAVLGLLKSGPGSAPIPGSGLARSLRHVFNRLGQKFVP